MKVHIRRGDRYHYNEGYSFTCSEELYKALQVATFSQRFVTSKCSLLFTPAILKRAV